MSELLDATHRDLGNLDELESPLTLIEVSALNSSPLFSLGPHTATHPRMSSISIEDATTDFAESVSTVMKWANSKLHYFPYPFGQRADFNRLLETKLNKSLGFRGLSTFPSALGDKQLKSLTLPRVSVQNWGIDQFRLVLSMANLFSYVPIAGVFALKLAAGGRTIAEAIKTSE